MLEAADFNGDGRQDLAWVNYSGVVSVAFGNGDGTFQAPSQYVLGPHGTDLAVADIDGDADIDLVVSNGDVFGGGSQTFWLC